MSPSDAARLLDLPADATSEQLEARFLELRRKLEDKIAKAPTPGLQAKYRESLTEITTAFETLTLAADSSSLPVLQKQGAKGEAPVADVGRQRTDDGGRNVAGAGTPSSRGSDSGPPPAKRAKSGGKEFALVAVIAIAVLGAGGWFVMKTRAENAEKARMAAEAKAEQERKIEEARLATEAKNQAEEVEKGRIDKFAAQLRSQLAEHKVAWEAVEREERNAERRLAELKSDLRGLRDVPAGQLAEAQALVAAQQSYSDWLSETLARHPARIARSQAEELLSAHQLDEAVAAVAELKSALAELEKQIPERRTELLDLEGDLTIRTAADATWTLTDAFGRKRSGQGSAELTGLAVGSGQLQLNKRHWPVRTEAFVIYRSRPAQLAAEYESRSLDLDSSPAGAEVRKADGTPLGVTPLHLAEFPPGPLTLSLHLEGYHDHRLDLTVPTGPNRPVIALKANPNGLVKPDRWAGPNRVTVETRGTTTMSRTNYSNHSVEEWDLTQYDPKSGWQQVTRKYLTYSNVLHAVQAIHPASGSIMRQRRQPDGKWAGEFVQGGVPDVTWNHTRLTEVPSLWMVSLGLFDIWPADEVAAGGSWTVKPNEFFRMLGRVKSPTGKVEAKLVSINREPGAERAVVEFRFTFDEKAEHAPGTLKIQIDLTDCYVTRGDIQWPLTGLVDDSYTMTVTKR